MRRLWPLFSVLLLMTACTSDSYDSGDGRYSYLRADFVRAHTVVSGEFDYALTDNGDSLLLSPHATAAWATRADSLYRALLYYNKVNDEAAPVALTQVPVISPVQTARPDTLHTDPLVFGSAWVDKGGRYLNVGYAVKTGRADNADSQYQTLGIRKDTTFVDEEGVTHVRFTLLHHQNGVPEYYSTRGYLSIPLADEPHPSVFSLSVNTYGGMVRKEVFYN